MPSYFMQLWFSSFLQKRFYTRGRIRGLRVPQLAEIPTFFMIGGNHLIKKRGNYLTA